MNQVIQQKNTVNLTTNTTDNTENVLQSHTTSVDKSNLLWAFILLFLRFPLIAFGQIFIYFCLGTNNNAWIKSQGYWPLYLVIFADIPYFIIVFKRCQIENISLKQMINFENIKKDILIGFPVYVGMSLCILIGRVLATFIIYKGDVESMPKQEKFPLGVIIFGLLVFPVTTGIVEEIVYRGYILTHFQKHFSNLVSIILITIGFSLHHTVIPIIDLKFGIAFFIALIPPCVFQVGLVLKQKRLVPIIVAHYLADLTSIIMLSFFNFF
eukprot:252383_1